MTQEKSIYRKLLTKKGQTSPGISVTELAHKATDGDTKAVYRRIYDLKKSGFEIYSNRRAGVTYYRLAA